MVVVAAAASGGAASGAGRGGRAWPRWVLVALSAGYAVALVIAASVFLPYRTQDAALAAADVHTHTDVQVSHSQGAQQHQTEEQRGWGFSQDLKALLGVGQAVAKAGAQQRPKAPTLARSVAARVRKHNASACARRSHSPAAIPRIIHQTWKTADVPYMAEPSVDSWRTMNPGYEYRFYTDDDITAYITAHHPEMLSAWRRMRPIHRADLFRYVILHDVGGYYADIDVTLQTPLDDWPLKHNTYFSAGVIVGFEIITQRPDWREWFSRQYQLCQWTMAAAPGHEVFARVIASIIDTFSSISDEDIQNKSAVKLTGPAVWSDAVTGHLHDTYGVVFGKDQFTDERLRDNYILVGDVLLMPMRSFAVGSAGYFPMGDFAFSDQLVSHGFQGSWKKRPNPQYAIEFERDFEAESSEGMACYNVDLNNKLALSGRACTSASSPAEETLANLFDGRDGTKWLGQHDFTGTEPQPLNVTVSLRPKQYAELLAYELTSGNDMHNRDPVQWLLVCVGEDDVEEVIHIVNSPVFSERMQTSRFRVKRRMSCHTFIFVFQQVLNPHKVDSMQLTALSLTDISPSTPSQPECEETAFGRLCACCVFDFKGKRGVFKLLDGDAATYWSTRWFGGGKRGNAALQPLVRFAFDEDTRLIRGYELISSPTDADSDPMAWRVVGQYRRGSDWEVLDERTNVVFTKRGERQPFFFTQPVAVAAAEWQLLATHNSSRHQALTHPTPHLLNLAGLSLLYAEEEEEAEEGDAEMREWGRK